MDSVDVSAALRLGWAVAEVRGRHWPDGPLRQGPPPPELPAEVLPLRSQRCRLAARREAAGTLAALARELDLNGAHDVVARLEAALPGFDDAGERLLTGGASEAERLDAWSETTEFFLGWDARIQDELAQRSEEAAIAYLLARGLAECYWGLGPRDAWGSQTAPSGVSLAFLAGPERRAELSRMLGRIGPDHLDPLSAAAISGSLEVWGSIARDEAWAQADDLYPRLREQVRRWYELLILRQDPTTLILPGARLADPSYLWKTVRMFWRRALFALATLALTVVVLWVIRTPGGNDLLASLLATGGITTLAALGLVAKAQSAAQQLVLRMRQDAYTDLVGVAVAIVPEHPGPNGRATDVLVEAAVRTRTLTTSTPSPQISRQAGRPGG